MKRYLTSYIEKDLNKKMVLLSGPRQVGKTTVSKDLNFNQKEYFNFDADEDREILKNKSWRKDVELIIFDELHKKNKWKSWLKGVYDKHGVTPRIIVTGSAKLDVYRKGGDSLAGRYFPYRLHPLSVGELKDENPKKTLDALLKLGGFPEPFLSASVEEVSRWRRTHVERILREDLIDLNQVQNIKGITLLVEVLAKKVGLPISYESLARDIEVSPNTIKRWIGILESLYVIFVISPYYNKIQRGIKKQPKIYFFDTGYIKGDESQRLENLVACSLLKYIHFYEDIKGESRRLHFVRDRNKKEIDFCVAKDNLPELALEVKLSDANVKQLEYYSKSLGEDCEKVCIVKNLDRELDIGKCKVRNAANWLRDLGV